MTEITLFAIESSIPSVTRQGDHGILKKEQSQLVAMQF
jgi:hypothetical protein